MKAKVIKTGKIVDVLYELGLSKGWFVVSFNGKEHSYHSSELDFNLNAPQKQSVTIEGWVARDMDKGLYLYRDKPHDEYDSWMSNYAALELPIHLFPDFKWEDEPRKVKITIEEV